jgi:hypothetical protein
MRVYRITLGKDAKSQHKSLYGGMDMDSGTILEYFDKLDILFEMVQGQRWVYVEGKDFRVRLRELENY